MMVHHRHDGLSMEGAFSRRSLIAGAAGMLATSACSSGARAAPEVKRCISLSALGVVASRASDQWSALSRAFATAAADGLTLIGDASAVYRHDGLLTLDGVSFDGQGCAFLALSEGPQALRCLGSGWRVSNLRLIGAATRRSDRNDCNGLWVGQEGGPSANDFILENIVIDSIAPGRGVATAGIMFTDAHRGRLIAPVVRRSLADGIHVTAGSTNLSIERALVEDSGDDAIAVVSYRSQGRLCRNIRVTDAVSRRSAARGIAIVGGSDVLCERPRVERSAAAGIYLYGEGSFDTYGTARVQVTDPVLVDCVTGRGLAPGFRNAAIVLGGREGNDEIGGETIPRGASGCVIRNASVTGAGDACTAAISMHQYAIAPRIMGGQIDGTRIGAAPARDAAVTGGIEIGGRDVLVEGVEMRDIAGIAIALLAQASGNCMVRHVTVNGSSRRPGPIDSFIYAEHAPALRHLTIRDSSFAAGPARLSISLLPPDRLQFSGNAVR